MERILVTGAGAVSAAGVDLAANFANLFSDELHLLPSPTLFPVEFRMPVFEFSGFGLNADLLPQQRTLALAELALKDALAGAGLDPAGLRNSQTGVCLGTTVACTLNDLPFYADFRAGKWSGGASLARYLGGDLAANFAKELNLSGPVMTIANACSSGANALGTALSWLRSGRCTRVIAGGSDELNLIPYCGFNALQVMSPEPCCPFARKRQGLTLGEGAGILILETETSARERGVSGVPLLSYGCAADAWHLTGPHPDGMGLERAIRQALASAELEAGEVDYINAHGTGTRDNDRVEALVFERVFGSGAIFSSTKYFTGHTLGAAGALEAAFCVEGIRRGEFPGNPSCVDPDPELPVFPEREKIPYRGGAVLSTSMAFGGNCAALIFGSEIRK